MVTREGQNFSLYAGNSLQVIITVYDCNDAVVDLTPYTTIEWTAYKQTSKESILTKSLVSGLTVPTPSNGQIIITFTPADTTSIAPALYSHQCEISTATDVYTVAVGTMKLLYNKN